MKTTTISVIILIVIIVMLAINSFLLNAVSDKLLMRLDELGDDPARAFESAKKLEDHWRSVEPYVSLSVSYLKVDKIGDAVTKIKISAEFGQLGDYMLAKELFKNSVEEIRFSGQLNLETVI